MRNWFWMAAVGLLASAQVAAQDKPDDLIRASLKSLNPDLRIDDIRPAPIDGLYEVTVPGQVVYVSADGKYLIQGMILDVAQKLDLTEQRRAELRKDLLAQAPESQRIIFKPKGEVKHKVVVFTDIDCGYCRELHKHVAEYNDRGIQIEYLMFPRAGVGSDSYRKAVATWCNKDQQGTLTKAKAGEDPGNASCINPIEAQYQLGQQLGVSGTPTLVLPDGNVAPGYVTPDQLEQRLMAAEVAVATAEATGDK